MKLEVRGLSVWFAGLRALDNITFGIDDGGIYSIIGPNGAGKTTLFNCISGLGRPTSGDIIFNGHRLQSLAPHKITALGMARTFQTIRLFSEMTALENVMIGGHSRTKTGMTSSILQLPSACREEKALKASSMELLEFVGLRDKCNNTALNLSYGDQRRLEIARALNADPTLLLLDEPAAGMNPSETTDLNELIRRINKMGITIALIEHDMKLVMDISDRVIVIDHGEKIAEGTPYEVQNNKVVIEAYLGIDALAAHEAQHA